METPFISKNEAETRAEHIDPALAAAGWGVSADSSIRREYSIAPGRIEGHGRRGSSLKADYVLEFRNRKLAVIEAKAWHEPLTLGVAQAKIYAGKLGLRFAYATNGQGIYTIDMHSGAETQITAYPSPEELWQMTFATRNDWRDRFAAIPYDDKGGSHTMRYYQEIAVERAMQAIADGRQRILLTLATGTGKTFIAFQIAWKLFQSCWNLSGEPTRRPRILFLADRNILANQAFNAFSSFPEDAIIRIKPDEIRRKGRVPKNGSLFFTIFQTFMTSVEDYQKSGFNFGQYPPDFFDFIIIDECHRGGANDESTWRGILDYFKPAVQLGLTATPRREENKDTYLYFGDPVYIYSLKDGINDGYLTPFRVRQITTSLDNYIYTPDDNVLEGEIIKGKIYEEKEFNRNIQIRERETKRVELFMSMINQKEKTLVFCANQEHALLVRDLINQQKRSSDPNYCQRVTANDGELGEQFLRDFQDNEKSVPTILTTSHKLSTGVDARNVRNIVLMRPIRQIIEFKQIIGRGTRLYDGKDYFTIYDFVGAYKLFAHPEWDGEPLEPEPCEICGKYPCECKTESEPCKICGRSPCVCPCPICGNRPCNCLCKVCHQRPCVCNKVKVQLADGKARAIQHMAVTTFWHPDGTPMPAQQFMEMLFGKLPEFFRNEEELRAIWSQPDTRQQLLQRLAEEGIGREQLAEMQRLIDAEQSDLFDVLSYVAYASPPLTRAARAAHARTHINTLFDNKQQVFLDFVLQHYVTAGVSELQLGKIAELLKLKYNDSLADAVADLGGDIETIRQAFVAFQKFLYEKIVAA